MVPYIGESSKRGSEAASAIEARSLRGAKEKTLALPRCFSERKLKMVPYIGESSNQLFRILDDWNVILKNIGKEEPKPSLPPKKRKRTWYKPKFTKLKRKA